jgi:hypothetical protein
MFRFNPHENIRKLLILNNSCTNKLDVFQYSYPNSIHRNKTIPIKFSIYCGTNLSIDNLILVQTL